MTTTQPGPYAGPVSYYAMGILIGHRITADHSCAGGHVGIEFRYDPGEPWSITLVLGYRHGRSDLRSWTFAREMLDRGRREPVGVPEGLVSIAPKAKAAAWVEFTLRDPDTGRTLLLSVEQLDIGGALLVAEQLVPLGAEHHPDASTVDAELAAILDAAGGEPR